MANRVSSTAIFIVATTLGATALPSAAPAQTLAAAGSLGWSKSDAILGAPSALDAILNEQGARRAPARVLQPAAYSIPRAIPAVARRNDVAEGVTSGRPDVFGSVALRVGRTPLDARWARVEHSPVRGAAARFGDSIADLPAREQLEAVNSYVNRRVRFTDDYRRFGRADVWEAADETLRSGRGDCEDYAIAKLQLLRRAGFADRDLYLTIVKDLVRRADHAVLVVRSGGHMYVLDNGTDAVLDSESIADYRPVLTFATTGAWTHGYRVEKPVTYASADHGPGAALLASASDQRSRNASLLAFNTGFNR
jgi:predicted transglutaminase-like cysteine proteinase